MFLLGRVIRGEGGGGRYNEVQKIEGMGACSPRKTLKFTSYNVPTHMYLSPRCAAGTMHKVLLTCTYVGPPPPIKEGKLKLGVLL